LRPLSPTKIASADYPRAEMLSGEVTRLNDLAVPKICLEVRLQPRLEAELCINQEKRTTRNRRENRAKSRFSTLKKQLRAAVGCAFVSRICHGSKKRVSRLAQGVRERSFGGGASPFGVEGICCYSTNWKRRYDKSRP
jgi:hypothetical protein